MPSGFVVLEPDNCFALFYFLINVCISHVIITLIRYFLIPKSRDLVSHNLGISGLKNGPGSRDPESLDVMGQLSNQILLTINHACFVTYLLTVTGSCFSS